MKKLAKMMQQAKQLQENMQDLQQGLEAMEVIGEAGAGMVKIYGNGKHDVKKVEFDPEILSESKEILEELTAAAINDLTQKIARNSKNKLSSMAASVLPTDFPFDLGGNEEEKK